MKKFYSLVLTAAALLIGTNAWAVYPAGWLQERFDEIEADGQTHTITMEDDIVISYPVYLGTATVDEARKSIILDMNGHHITMDASAWAQQHGTVFCSMFNITHGELLVRNSDKSTTSLIQMTGSSVGNYNDIFNVAGSYKSSRWVKNGNSYDTIPVAQAINTRDEDGGWFTHLEIGEGVKLFAANTVNGAGISIDGYYTNFHGMVSPTDNKSGVFPNSALTAGANNVVLFDRADAPRYNTAILKAGSEGVAYGVRVDVKGDIEFASESTTSGGKSYGIKLNGGLRSSLREGETFLNQNIWNIDEAYARSYGATDAPTTNTTKTFIVPEEAYKNHRNDTVDAPFLYVHSSAHIIAAAEMNEATAIYCSGYGKTLIEGACSGNSGINVKSGTVEIHDAEITCTATETSVYAAENGNKATGTGAVVVNSVDGRAGGIEVIISGDSKVSTDYGYAIAETVTANNDGTKVTSITIDGGTIQGGASTATNDGGAIIVSETTKDNENAEVVVYGTNLTGNTNVQSGGAGDLDDLLPKTGAVITEVIVDGKPTIVVSQGETPDEVDEDATDTEHSIMNASEASITWTGTVNQIIDGNKTLDYLEMNLTTGTTPKTPVPQQLTIESGYTLTVGRVVLGEAAVIIVKPGAKFIVTGAQGIVAPKASNIVLKASEAAQATFLFNPAVTSNRHPNAKVEYHSNSFYSDHNVQQFFGLPTYNGSVTNIETTSGAKIYFDLWRNPGWDYIGAINVPGDPDVMANLNKFNVPFGLVCITSKNDAASKPVFTFSGELTGNMDHSFTLQQGWTSMANAYTGPIAGSAIISQLAKWNASYGTEQNVYVYTLNPATGNIQWSARNKYVLTSGGLNAMAPIMFHNGSKVEGVVLDYSDLVWDPMFPAQNPAPARREASNITKVQINIAGENEADYTTIVADSELGDDKSFCAPKYGNAGLQLYVMGNEKFDIYAADEIENSYIGYRTVNAGMYTISFENVQGEDLVLVDLANGARTNIEEGAIYTFHAEANESNDYRFEIVGRANMPTAIDNTEAVKSAKGIYTITGQYMGEMNVWNSLPAGVYVVNGEKRVK